MQMDEFAKRMYREFNGFDDGEMDARSAFSIWPLDRVMPVSDVLFEFGDFLINSDMLLFDPRDAKAPVMANLGKELVANSLSEFWEKLLNGDYDFIS